MATVGSIATFSITSSSSSFFSHLPTYIPSQFSFNRPKPKCPLSTSRAAIYTALTPTTMLETSSSGIVLVDKSDSDKVNRLKSIFFDKVVPILKEEFGYKNIHEVPRIEKITVNCGIGDAEQNSKGLEATIKDLSLITGQRPVKTRAKKSIASFKLREGATVGIAVTLRGNVMYSFLDRLINLALPRTRDFQGLNPNSFDGHGNYSIGMRDQSVFPEIRYEALGKTRGMDVCISTSASADKEAQRLLALLGMPFKAGAGPAVLMPRKRKKAHHFDSKIKDKK
ncbi:50S ribosomal protein L5, chloroplastic [Phalaenopsis equestris]|uniref:50S ribosomal protein L5, chloroplastic n=1 Tax=Phalaenopsis equestris TaxID=78828 RepID=UPI0009E4EB8F|nr:50S ribosomal protein L5, chloroplastic [Phalaenopsis equestris]